MDAPPSAPHPLTFKGTLLGFPVRVSPAHDFERWSIPPPNGLDPIVPCEEPDDEEVQQFFPPPRAASPMAVVRPAPVMNSFVFDDPVILPTRNRDRHDRRFWLLMSVAILIAIALAATLLVAI